MVIVYYFLGPISILAFILIVAVILGQRNVLKGYKSRDKRRRKFIDSRSGIVNQIVTGIKNLKFNAWEYIFKDKIDGIRKKEKNILQKMFELTGLSLTLMTSVAPFAGYICFSFLLLTFTEMSVADIYASMMYLNRMRYCLKVLNNATINYYNSLPSFKRIDQMLRIDESQDFYTTNQSDELEVGSIEYEGLSSTWDDFELKNKLKFISGNKEDKEEVREENEEQTYLKDINLKVGKGEFTVLIGQTASGKSSVVKALMGQMKTLEGSVTKNGRVAYISQQAFLVNETLRNNIVFGSEYDEEKYERIVRICQLETDIEMLPAGDQTEIGERGINLSGGQKQRVSIARAVYSDSDIYLIDDCLSALDAHVGKAILEQVFFDHLKDKTRLMVSHHTYFLDKVDKIAIMKKGEIFEQGTFEELSQNPAFKEFQEKTDKIEEEGSKKTPSKSVKKQKDSEKNRLEKMSDSKRKQTLIPLDFPEKYIKSKKTAGELVSTKRKTKSEINIKFEGNLTQEENRSIGVVDWGVILFYLKKGGLAIFLIIFSLFSLCEAFNLLINWWSSVMFEDEITHRSTFNNFLIFTGLIFGFLLINYLKLFLFSFFCASAGYNIFDTLIWNIIRKPLSFFDTTHSGVILNRAIDDMEAADLDFPKYSTELFDYVATILGSYFLVFIASPSMIVIIIICNIINLWVFFTYLTSSTDLKRLFRVSRSPVITTISEMVNGMTQIRTYDYQGILQKKWEKYHDLSINTQLHEQYCLIWVCLWTNISFFLLAFAVGVMFVITRCFR